ncbi:hypothetical protein KC332_g5418 [Hortaea werneckii]|uniref:Uncharacterized protein n=1 Tax=Hortaea werneckii TaxID=91943 RepID=A0A3M7J2M6_HORWE|nr:hypothetical protein KC358_g5524 [Hortaea werneckii]KAI6845399.1 hypothetical protein KC350_g4472 [Hortaea werneckii]KAI6937278.1 hypothetical protein KC348_g5773 [Hortaea werneckii]KAI6937751.1 hypothetical protein KC341_g5366 [Hortaea werneckii]KAI6973322.1 hypothetical protein KC321_g5734 [Hortaea werneckii]
MAEDQEQMEDVVINDGDLTQAHAQAEEPAHKPDPDFVMTEAPPTSTSKLQKTAARCKRRADHILHIIEQWWESDSGVLICERFEELKEALEDEKNYTSEAMRKLVLEARDLFTKSQNTQRDLNKLLAETFASYTGYGGTGPGGLWHLLEMQERVIERMDRKIECMTSPAESYEWWDDYDYRGRCCCTFCKKI